MGLLFRPDHMLHHETFPQASAYQLTDPLFVLLIPSFSTSSSALFLTLLLFFILPVLILPLLLPCLYQSSGSLIPQSSTLTIQLDLSPSVPSPVSLSTRQHVSRQDRAAPGCLLHAFIVGRANDA